MDSLNAIKNQSVSFLDSKNQLLILCPINTPVNYPHFLRVNKEHGIFQCSSCNVNGKTYELMSFFKINPVRRIKKK